MYLTKVKLVEDTMKITGNSIQVDLMHGMKLKAEPSTQVKESKSQEIMDILQIEERKTAEEVKQYTLQFDALKWKEEFANDPSRAKEKLLEWTLIGAGKSYAEKLEKIKKSGFDESKQKQLISHLDQSYRTAINENIKTLVKDYNSYFDRGKKHFDTYSEKESKDLFNEDVFAAHLADMALVSKESFVKFGADEAESIAIQNMNALSSSSIVEKMSYFDLKKSIGYINKPVEVFDSNAKGSALGKQIAQREMSETGQIDKLGLSRSLRDKMVSVQKRISEGMMRNRAFMEEEGYYEKLKEDMYEELQKLLERLKMFDVQMKKIKEEGLFDPNNDLLMNVLNRRHETQTELRRLKEGIKENEESFGVLKDDPSKIVTKDSYKKAKAGYLFEIEMQEES